MLTYAEVPHARVGAQVWSDGKVWRLGTPGPSAHAASQVGQIQSIRHGVSTIRVQKVDILSGSASLVTIPAPPIVVKLKFRDNNE